MISNKKFPFVKGKYNFKKFFVTKKRIWKLIPKKKEKSVKIKKVKIKWNYEWMITKKISKTRTNNLLENKIVTSKYFY